MKITCLTENTSADERLLAEHGLSLLIETGNKKILFDMGQTDAFYDNAEKLGIDLKKVDFAVLSHGHYDHGGGLKKFFEINTCAPVYISRYAFEPHYNGTEKYIGLDVSLSGNERLIFTDGFVSVGEGITLHSCNGAELLNDIDSGGLNKLENGLFIPDDFLHEHYLMIEENGKKILFSGCSHKGIINICDLYRPDVLIGGFHFSKYPLDDKFDSIAERLAEYDIEYYTCHCTGVEQYRFIKSKIKNLHYLSSGNIVKL